MMFISTFKNKSLYGLSVVMFFIIFFSFCQNVSASTYNEDYDSYADGQDYGTDNTDGWTLGNPGYEWLVDNDQYTSSPNSLEVANAQSVLYKNFDGVVDSVSMQFAWTNSSESLYVIYLANDDGEVSFFKYRVRSDEQCELTLTTGPDSNSYVQFGSNPCISDSAFHELELIASSTSPNYYQGCIDGSCSVWFEGVATTSDNAVRVVLRSPINSSRKMAIDDLAVSYYEEAGGATEFTYIEPVFGSTIYKQCDYSGCGQWAEYRVIFDSTDVGYYDNIRITVWNETASGTDLIYYQDYDPWDIWYGQTYLTEITAWPVFDWDIDTGGYKLNQAIFYLWGMSGLDSPVLLTSTSSYYYVGTTSKEDLIDKKISALTSRLCDDDPCLGISSTTDAWYEIADDIHCGLRLVGNWLFCPDEEIFWILYDEVETVKTQFPFSGYFALSDYVSNIISSSSAATGNSIVKLPKPDGAGGIEWQNFYSSSTMENAIGSSTTSSVRTLVGYFMWLLAIIISGIALIAVSIT
jgi:hypothetical protein